MAAAFAAGVAAASSASAAITYAVDQTIGGGGVVGTITTDGRTGELQAGDITGWSLKLTGNGASATLDTSNSVVDDYGHPTGLSATAQTLSFDFDPGQDALFAIQIDGGLGGHTYWCDASFSGDCAAGESVVPVLFSDSSSVYDASPDSLQVIGVAAVPEPATWAMLILGLGLIGWAARRRNASVAVPA